MAEAKQSTASAYKKPLPPMSNPYALEFYKYCKQHELRFQRCTSCGTWRHIPRDMCGHCGSIEAQWEQSSGRGKVFSWTTVIQPILPQFADAVPYIPAVIEMDEGVRIVSWLVDVKPEEIELDMPVEVIFDDVSAEVALPKFKRR
jgi:uncharacterized OB-fold protein